jgi:uncharacterized protein (DUF983 family)
MIDHIVSSGEIERKAMSRFFMLLARGIVQRCPVCGQGKLFHGIFQMNETCPVCGFKFEREVGYFTSAMAIDLVLSELIAAAIVLPLAANLTIPALNVMLIGGPFVILLPLLLYRPSRSIWLAMDHYLNPISGDDLPDESLLLQRSRGIRNDQ